LFDSWRTPFGLQVALVFTLPYGDDVQMPRLTSADGADPGFDYQLAKRAVRLLKVILLSWGGSTMSTVSSVKTEALRLVEQLPDDATWDDLLYEIYVRQSIEAGLKDCREGRTLPVAEVRRRLGLPT
jgi:hypothetical protein